MLSWLPSPSCCCSLMSLLQDWTRKQHGRFVNWWESWQTMDKLFCVLSINLRHYCCRNLIVYCSCREVGKQFTLETWARISKLWSTISKRMGQTHVHQRRTQLNGCCKLLELHQVPMQSTIILKYGETHRSTKTWEKRLPLWKPNCLSYQEMRTRKLNILTLHHFGSNT